VTLSIVIPALNEDSELPETVRRARAVPEVVEVIVVDGGSTDGTRELASNLGCVVLASAPSRGGQLRRGAVEAKGDVVVLLHADTWLPANAGRAIADCLADPRVVGGGFYKVFRDPPSWLVRGSRFKCWCRWLVARRVMGDQAMFARRAALEAVGGVPDVPLMEEFELCRLLRARGRLALADAVVSTSARRFVKRGVLRTYWLMWRVTARHWLGAKPEELAEAYREGK
jgi:rSAM/selenodomain-associated transferase 2